MSEILKPIAAVAGAVASVAAFIPGAQPVAAIAGLVAGVANIGAQITAPQPVAKGNIVNVLVEAEPPRPYMMGESYSAGVLRHKVGYGPVVNDVPNPYWLEIKVFSAVGPVQGLIEEQFDFQPIAPYYQPFTATALQLGNRPEASALVPPYGAAPNWGADYRLSGCAAMAVNYLFDKDGEVFASGRPKHGAIWQGEKCYDPRKDNSQPGGSGTHVLGDESTYTYSTNPALHAGTYAYGRYENGIKILGVGLSRNGIDWPAVIEWANDCDANNWRVDGTIFEGGRGVDPRQQRVRNLDDICAAGGGRWITAGALLSFDWHRPRVPLATITDEDLLEAGISAVALQSLRDRMNGVRPEYISQAHNWEQITGDEIVGSTYRAEDGQSLTQTWPLNLVKVDKQAGELAAYAMADSREIGPIEANLGHEWRFYRPGEALTLDSELLGYTGQVVILERGLDPATVDVMLKFKSEDPDKHPFALGQTATPPSTPILGQTGQERDAVAARNAEPVGFSGIAISGSYTSGLAGNITQSHNGDGTVDVVIPDHERIYSNNKKAFVTGATLTLAETSTFLIYYDDPNRSSGAQSYQTTTVAADAYYSDANPNRHFIASVTTVDSGGGGGSAGGSSPPGGGGWFDDGGGAGGSIP